MSPSTSSNRLPKPHEHTTSPHHTCHAIRETEDQAIRRGRNVILLFGGTTCHYGSWHGERPAGLIELKEVEESCFD